VFDLARVERAVQLRFLIEDARFAREFRALFPCDLGDCTTRGEVPAQDLEMAGGFDRVRERPDDDLVLRQRGEGSDVLGEGFACDGGDRAVKEAGGAEKFLDGGHTADGVEVGHEVLS